MVIKGHDWKVFIIKTLVSGIILLMAAGCSLAPEYKRPKTPVPDKWVQNTPFTENQKYKDAEKAKAGQHAADNTSKKDSGLKSAVMPKWQNFFIDKNLRKIIRTALDNNRNLRLSILNVERARALYGIKRAGLFPGVDAVGVGNKQRIPSGMSSSHKATVEKQYSVNFGISSWEIDFFGRLRSLKKQALQNYLATDQARRSVQILLIEEVSRAYFTFAADKENLKLAGSTLDSRKNSYELILSRYRAGLANELDLSRAGTQVDLARGKVIDYVRKVALDKNVLDLLAGLRVPEKLLPRGISGVKMPAGISYSLRSDILLHRPDIMAAEHQLKGAYALIGAARASFFPRISLTTGIGTASRELSDLFKSGSGTWNFKPQAVMPVFDPRIWAAYRVSKTERKIALTKYEKVIQTAFKEVADALAVRDTIGKQIAAQQSLVNSLADTCRLAENRYVNGIDSYLGVLDAQRSLFAARQNLTLLHFEKIVNDVKLYAVLGGGSD